MADVAIRSDLAPCDVVMRFGLHWGSTLYMGNVITSARSEVNAFGDEANEAARMQSPSATSEVPTTTTSSTSRHHQIDDLGETWKSLDDPRSWMCIV
jgi:class 3 adenylate cyclase